MQGTRPSPGPDLAFGCCLVIHTASPWLGLARWAGTGLKGVPKTLGLKSCAVEKCGVVVTTRPCLCLQLSWAGCLRVSPQGASRDGAQCPREEVDLCSLRQVDGAQG